jgi:energy-converting hydrogenase A subunit M
LVPVDQVQQTAVFLVAMVITQYLLVLLLLEAAVEVLVTVLLYQLLAVQAVVHLIMIMVVPEHRVKVTEAATLQLVAYLVEAAALVVRVMTYLAEAAATAVMELVQVLLAQQFLEQVAEVHTPVDQAEMVVVVWDNQEPLIEVVVEAVTTLVDLVDPGLLLYDT